MSQLKHNVLNILKANANREDLLKYMEDVIEHRCISGIVPQLIYTYDCVEFVKDNLEDIFDVMEVLEHPICITLTDMAWLAFEYTVYELYNQFKEEPPVSEYEERLNRIATKWFIIMHIKQMTPQEVEEYIKDEKENRLDSDDLDERIIQMWDEFKANLITADMWKGFEE